MYGKREAGNGEDKIDIVFDDGTDEKADLVIGGSEARVVRVNLSYGRDGLDYPKSAVPCPCQSPDSTIPRYTIQASHFHYPTPEFGAGPRQYPHRQD